jgi:hypothetical protein
VSHGLRDSSVVEAPDELWLVDESVGDSLPLQRLLARLAVNVAESEKA